MGTQRWIAAKSERATFLLSEETYIAVIDDLHLRRPCHCKPIFRPKTFPTGFERDADELRRWTSARPILTWVASIGFMRYLGGPAAMKQMKQLLQHNARTAGIFFTHFNRCNTSRTMRYEGRTQNAMFVDVCTDRAQQDHKQRPQFLKSIIIRTSLWLSYQGFYIYLTERKAWRHHIQYLPFEWHCPNRNPLLFRLNDLIWHVRPLITYH